MTEAQGSSTQQRTVLGRSARQRTVLFATLAVVGLIVGFVLPFIAGSIEDSVGDPWDELLELIAETNNLWVALALAVVGIVIGLLLARIVLAGTLKITVTDSAAAFSRNKRTREIAREQVHAAFLDGAEIVLQDANSTDLIRERHDLPDAEAARVSEAFTGHGFPWRSGSGEPG